MTTTMREEKIRKEGQWKECGSSYLCPNTITNTVSTSDAIYKGYHVVFDLAKENCFYVTDRNNRAICFPCLSRGLYVRSMDTLIDCWFFNLARDIEGFTQREMDRARAARKFYHDLNAESTKNMKTYIRSNLAKIFQYPPWTLHELKYFWNWFPDL